MSVRRSIQIEKIGSAFIYTQNNVPEGSARVIQAIRSGQVKTPTIRSYQPIHQMARIAHTIGPTLAK